MRFCLDHRFYIDCLLWSFRLVETICVCLPASVVISLFICRVVNYLQLDRKLFNNLLLFSVGTVCKQLVQVFDAPHQRVLLAVFTSVRPLSELIRALVHCGLLLIKRWLTAGLARQHHSFPQKVFCRFETSVDAVLRVDSCVFTEGLLVDCHYFSL